MKYFSLELRGVPGAYIYGIPPGVFHLTWTGSGPPNGWPVKYAEDVEVLVAEIRADLDALVKEAEKTLQHRP